MNKSFRLTALDNCEVSTIHNGRWYETIVFYNNGRQRVIPNEACNEHDAMINHDIVVSSLGA